MQFLAGLDRRSGRTVWRTPRPPFDAEGPPYRKSFSTPLVIEAEGQEQVVAIGPHWIVAYEPTTGQEIWRLRHGKGYSIAPRPVYGHGMVYVCTGDYVAQLLAIRVNGHGDVSQTHVVWKATQQIPLMSSPLLVGRQFLFVVLVLHEHRSGVGVGGGQEQLGDVEPWQLGGHVLAEPLLDPGPNDAQITRNQNRLVDYPAAPAGLQGQDVGGQGALNRCA